MCYFKNCKAMTAYDSDSSDGEEQDYTETEVLLGFTSKDPKGETISRLGGYPVRLARRDLHSKYLCVHETPPQGEAYLAQTHREREC